MLPTQSDTLLAMAYLIGPGSIGVFLLALYVLARWTASATSYAFLLFPLVAIVLGAVLFDEPVQPSFLLGGAIVLVGVYVGAIYRPKAGAEDARARPGVSRSVNPGALLVGVRLGGVDGRGQVRAGRPARLLALGPVQLLVDRRPRGSRARGASASAARIMSGLPQR